MGGLKVIGSIIVTFFIIISSILSIVIVQKEAVAYTIPGSIIIVGNDDFTSENGVTGGSGTPEDPYIIEGWDTSNTSIYIKNTTSHLIIRNMLIIGIQVNLGWGGGLDLINVSNCLIEYCRMVPVGVEDFTSFKIDDCSNITIRNNMIDKNNHVANSNNIIFESNLIRKDGLYINQCQEVNIHNNTLIDCSARSYPGWAIKIRNSDSVIIQSNYIANRTVLGVPSYGISLDHSTNVIVQGNCLLNNTISAQDTYGPENSWNLSYSIGGNYWSNYEGADIFQGPIQNISGSDDIGDTPYVIDSNSSDYYPLMSCDLIPLTDFLHPITVISWSGIEGQNGWYVSSVDFYLRTYDDYNDYNWTQYRINESEWYYYNGPFELDQDGIYNLEFYSEDIYGNTEPINEIIILIDITSPILSIVQGNNMTFDSNNVSFSWHCLENMSGIDRFEYNIDEGGFISCGYDTSVTISNLSDGEHKLVIRAIDNAGNSAEQEITFEINTNIFSMEGPYGPWLLIAIIAGIIIAIAFLIMFLRPKKGSPEVSSVSSEEPQ